MKPRLRARIIALLVAGTAVRLLWLGPIPRGIGLQEVSIGYDAWALLHAGVDHDGIPWWRSLLAWRGDQSPLAVILSMPFVALGGPTVLATRVAGAMWGVLSLLMFWRLSRRAEPGMEGWAVLLLVTSPWHFAASRLALGAHLAPATVLLATLLLARAPERPWIRLPMAAAALTASVYAYAPSCLFAPLFLAWGLFIVHRSSPMTRKSLLATLAVSPFMVLPAALLVSGWPHAGRPGLCSEDFARYLEATRHGSLFLPFAPGGLALLPENALRVVAALLGGAGDGSPWSAIPGWEPQYVVLTPFLVWGVLHAVGQHRTLVDGLMVAWLVSACITSAVVEASADSMNLVWLPASWLSARGLWLLGERGFLSLAARAIVSVFGAAFAISYFGSGHNRAGEASLNGFGDAVARALARAPKDTTVVVTTHSPRPYVPTLFFSRTPPARFMATVVMSDPRAPFQSVLGFDRFRFGIGVEQLEGSRKAESYWVVHRSELGLFDNDLFVAETFGQHAVVSRRTPAEMRCLLPIDARWLSGKQDVGTLGIDGMVGASGAGFSVTGLRFARGFGAHGDSSWQVRLGTPARQLSFGIGLSDSATCSDGVAFRVLADGKQVFSTVTVPLGEIQYHVVPLERGATVLTFVTRAGPTLFCDYADWLRPTVLTCAP